MALENTILYFGAHQKFLHSPFYLEFKKKVFLITPFQNIIEIPYPYPYPYLVYGCPKLNHDVKSTTLKFLHHFQWIPYSWPITVQNLKYRVSIPYQWSSKSLQLLFSKDFFKLPLLHRLLVWPHEDQNVFLLGQPGTKLWPRLCHRNFLYNEILQKCNILTKRQDSKLFERQCVIIFQPSNQEPTKMFHHFITLSALAT